jgi:hypothetical protein
LGNNAKNPGGASQRQAVEKMVTCLEKAGVKAELMESEKDEETDFNIVSDKPYQLCFADGSCSMNVGDTGGQELSEADWEALYQKMEAQMDPYRGTDGNTKDVLFVDSKDLTKEYRACVKESGYKQPVYKQDPAEEMKQKQATAKAGAEWAACARQNGLPNVKDPVAPKADGYETFPTVIIPGKVTVDQLTALLAKCPTFDAEAQKAYDEAWQNWKEGDPEPTIAMPEMPQITLDDAAMGFDLSDPDATMDPAVEKEMTALYDILYKAQSDYYAAQQGSGFAR